MLLGVGIGSKLVCCQEPLYTQLKAPCAPVEGPTKRVFLAGALRGGGGQGGFNATARKRDERLLQALAELVFQFQGNQSGGQNGCLEPSAGPTALDGSYYPPRRHKGRPMRTLP